MAESVFDRSRKWILRKTEKDKLISDKQPNIANRAISLDGSPLSTWIFTVIASSIYVVVLCVILRPSFWTNDNVAIILNAKQGLIVRYVGLVFFKVLFFLYSEISQAISWYSAIFLASHLISLSLAIDGFRRVIRSKLLYTAVLVFYGVAYSVFVFALDYTSTSIMLSGNAVVYFVIRYNPRQRQWALIVITALLVCAGTQFRLKSLPAVGIYILPSIFYLVYLTYKTQGASFKSFISGVLLLVAIFGPAMVLYKSDFVYKKYYSPVNYKRYGAFNRLRGQIHGFLVEPTSETLAQNNWSQNDFIRLQNWMFFDEEKYNTVTLKRLLELSPKPSEKTDKKLLMQKLGLLIKDYRAYWVVLVCSLLIVLVTGTAGTFRNAVYRYIPISMGCVYIVGVSAVFTVLYRFPFRLGWPALLISIFGMIVVGTDWNRKTMRPDLNEKESAFAAAHRVGKRAKTTGSRTIFPISNRTIGILFISSLLCLSSWTHFRHMSTIYHYRMQMADRFDQTLKLVNQKGIDSTILLQPGDSIRLEYYNPFSSIELPFQPINVGWNTFSPRFYQQIQALHINRGVDLVNALVDRPGAYVLAKQYWIDLLINYAKEKGLGSLGAAIVDHIDTELKLYSLEWIDSKT